MASAALPLVRVHGKPYERGFQHGSQCGDLIARYSEVLGRTIVAEAAFRALLVSPATVDRQRLADLALTFLPQLEAFAPHLVEEIRGIADGANLPFAEVLLCNVRAEVMGLERAACTAFAVGRGRSATGSPLSGQNLDQDVLNRDLQIVLHVEPDDGPAVLMLTFAGLVGYPGLNSAGVSFFQNALSTPFWRPEGMPHYLFKRVLLEQGSLEECLALFKRAKFCSSANYVLTDRMGVLDVDTTPDAFAIVPSRDDLVVHTNHFLDEDFSREEALLAAMPDSATRRERMRDLLQARDTIGVADLKAMLSDHERRPGSVCSHLDGRETISSIIAEPGQGRLHVAIGNPCQNEYATYSL